MNTRVEAVCEHRHNSNYTLEGMNYRDIFPSVSPHYDQLLCSVSHNDTRSTESPGERKHIELNYSTSIIVTVTCECLKKNSERQTKAGNLQNFHSLIHSLSSC